MKLTLGSHSEYKKYELEQAGFFVENQVSADIDEKAIRTDDPYNLPKLLANKKMEALLPWEGNPTILLTSDVVVVLHGKVLEKPESREQLHNWAKEYENNTCDIVSGIALYNTTTGEQRSDSAIYTVEWGPINTQELDAIIEKGEVFSCAGFNQEMLDTFAIQYASSDCMRGVPVDLVASLYNDVA